MSTLRNARFIVVLMSLAACAVTPPARDWATDTAAIREIYRTGPASVAQADIEGYLALLDDSVALLFPNAPAARGKPAVRAMLEGLFAAGSHTATLNPPRIGVADSLAFAEYTGVFVTHPRPSGDSIISRLRYVDVLRRQKDGSWRLLVHSAHPDAAPTP